MPDNRIQREIEDILTRLDEFVPEERVTKRVRRRSSDLTTAFQRAVIAPLGRIAAGQMMLAGVALIVLSLFIMQADSGIARWLIIAGVALFLTSFALSIFKRPRGTPQVKYWRDRPMVLEEPGLGDRFRAWLRNRRRSRP